MAGHALCKAHHQPAASACAQNSTRADKHKLGSRRLKPQAQSMRSRRASSSIAPMEVRRAESLGRSTRSSSGLNAGDKPPEVQAPEAEASYRRGAMGEQGTAAATTAAACHARRPSSLASFKPRWGGAASFFALPPGALNFR